MPNGNKTKKERLMEISEEDGDGDEQYEEDSDGTTFARVSEEVKAKKCRCFAVSPTVADNVTKGQNQAIVLQNIQIMVNKKQPNNTHFFDL